VAADPEYKRILSELNRLWLKYKDCAGAACSVPLPEKFAMSPAQTAVSTRAQSEGVLARYGLAF
jgi:hypothetical protein